MDMDATLKDTLERAQLRLQLIKIQMDEYKYGNVISREEALIKYKEKHKDE